MLGVDHGDVMDSDSDEEDIETNINIMNTANNTIAQQQTIFNMTNNANHAINSNNQYGCSDHMTMESESIPPIIPKVDADGWETIVRSKRKTNKK